MGDEGVSNNQRDHIESGTKPIGQEVKHSFRRFERLGTEEQKSHVAVG